MHIFDIQHTSIEWLLYLKYLDPLQVLFSSIGLAACIPRSKHKVVAASYLIPTWRCFRNQTMVICEFRFACDADLVWSRFSRIEVRRNLYVVFLSVRDISIRNSSCSDFLKKKKKKKIGQNKHVLKRNEQGVVVFSRLLQPCGECELFPLLSQ